MSENLDFVPKSSAQALTNIFFLIDISGSMDWNGKIDAVNNAVRESLPIIRDFASKQKECKIQCSVVTFNDKVEWIIEGVDAEDLQWIDVKASGGTRLGETYKQLSGKLSRHNGGLMAMHMNNAPIIILFTDGCPTDDADTPLTQLKQNKWFKSAIKIAVELPGNDIDRQKLIDFATREMVIPVTLDGLKEKLQNIIIQTVTHSLDAEEVLKKAIKENQSESQEDEAKFNPDNSNTNNDDKSKSLDLDDFDI